VIGSQSVLGQFPDAPVSLLASMEADLYPVNRPELADLVDGSIGEGSFFHEQYGYYAQGVSETTATLPAGWKKRLVRIRNDNTGGVEGMCLEVHDLAISKYAAGREKDLAFTRELARHGMTRRDTLLERVSTTKMEPELGRLVEARIARDFAPARRRKK